MTSEKIKKSITLLFHSLLLITPFVFTWVNEELFEFNKMLFVYGHAVLIVGLWAMRMILAKKLIIKKTPLDLPIFLFLVSQIISTILSIHPRTSFFGYYTRFNGGLLSTLTYISLFYAFVSNIDKRQVISFFLSLTLAGLLVSVYAIPEHFGHSPSCLIITGRFDVDCWVQDVQNRVFASFGQPNWLSAYTISIIPIILGLFFSNKNKKIATFLYISFFALLLATIFTKSRSGQLGLIVGLAIYFCGLLWIAPSKIKNLFKYKYFFISGIIAIIVFGTSFTPSYKELFFSNVSQNLDSNPAQEPIGLEAGGTDSGEIRKIVWNGAIKIWQRYPYFGSGVETFAYSYYLDRPIEHNLVSEWDFLYNKAHNEFLNLLANSGILGLMTYLIFLLSIVISLIRYLNNKDKNYKYLSLGILSSIGALSVSNFFGFSTVMTSVLLFLLPAFFIVISDEEDDLGLKKIKHNYNLLSYFGVAFVFVVVGFGLAGTYRIWKADKLFAEGKALIRANEYVSGLAKIQSAIFLSPHEALFYDELASTYSSLAVYYFQNQDKETSQQLLDASIQTSDYVLQLNNRHLNFYKTRARIFINLAQIDPSYLNQAQKTLEIASELAPTDPKLVYNLALVTLSQEEIQKGIDLLEKSIDMKPNYINPRMEIAKQFENQNRNQEAIQQYQYIIEKINPDDAELIKKIEMLQNTEN